MGLSCRKTPIKSVQKFICPKKKSEKTFLDNRASEAHLKCQDTFALLNTYPKQTENKTMKAFAKYSEGFFLWEVSG